MDIALHDGQVAIVDSTDLTGLLRWVWYAMPRKYGYHAYRVTSRSEGSKTVYMHRQILSAPIGMEVDHVNGNGLDNRRSNLRLVTKSQNGLNRHNRPARCKFLMGIERQKNGRFQARIMVRGQRYNLGTYDTMDEAHKVYIRARRHALCGEEV